MSQLKKGAILSYCSIFLTTAVGLVLTPYIIRSLGKSEYGLYTLIGSFVAYLSMMDLGLNNAIIRFVALFRVKNQKEDEENFLATIMLIYAVIAFVVVLLGLIIYYNLDSIFVSSLNKDQLLRVKLMFLILIFDLTISLPGGAFVAICSAYEHFVFPRVITILKYVLRAISIFITLYFGGGAISIILVDTCLNILMIIVMAAYSFKVLKVRFKLHKLSRTLVKKVFSYSIWSFVMFLIGQMMWSSGQLLLGIKVNTTTVAVYSIGVMLGTYYGAFSTAISSVFLPRATKMIIENSLDEQTLMMSKIGRLSYFVLMFILIGFLSFGKQFIILWVGKSFLDSWSIALLIMVSYTIPLIQNFANSLIEAKNLVFQKAIMYGGFISIGLILGYFLIPYYGAFGMIFGLCVGWLAAQLGMNYIYSKLIGLNIGFFFRSIFIDKLFIMTLAALACAYVINQISEVSWLILFSKVGVFSLIYIALGMTFGLNTEEKSAFLKI